MSLQKEVIRTMTDPLCSVEHRADKIVNKVLDAAVKACKDTMVYDEYDPSRTFIESINKLRPES